MAVRAYRNKIRCRVYFIVPLNLVYWNNMVNLNFTPKLITINF